MDISGYVKVTSTISFLFLEELGKRIEKNNENVKCQHTCLYQDLPSDQTWEFLLDVMVKSF
jgi:hypothetical protein